ncbi:MAG: class I fructose-bisphosphate aldolase [Gammaproteobacteria bacterium]
MTAHNELHTTIEALVQPGKGILAADESTGTMGKRFTAIELENNSDNRQAYRSLLCTTPDLEKYINGVILFEETLTQGNNDGTLLPEVLMQKGIVPGIKVDKGLVTLANTADEKITQGLDGLSERLQTYKEQGARFAKWRNVYAISDNTPSLSIIKSGAEVLGRYAATCQDLGIVPIVEPEVLIDGPHNIDQCADVCEIVLHELFKALFVHQVQLEYIVLKPSMVLPGKECKEQCSATEIAEYTLSVCLNHVPAAVPSINFLSGGQTPEQATANLNAINSNGEQPWQLSFSYGRALQEPCLKAWQGNAENINEAQNALLERAKLNAAAALGEYVE